MAHGVGFRVQGLGSRGYGLGFRVYDLGEDLWGHGERTCHRSRPICFACQLMLPWRGDSLVLRV